MKYINNRNKEPKELAEYRETPDATYDGFAEKKLYGKVCRMSKGIYVHIVWVE